MSDTPAPKEVQPMTLERERDDNSPMTMPPRPDYVVERPPVGSVGANSVEPVPGADPSVINQPSARGDAVAEPGTPDTIDPATGFETNTTSVALLEANQAKAEADEKAANEPEVPADVKAEAELNVVPPANEPPATQPATVNPSEAPVGSEVPKTEGGSKA